MPLAPPPLHPESEGMGCGLLLCVVARKATNEAVLPAVMVLIPMVFYAIG